MGFLILVPAIMSFGLLTDFRLLVWRPKRKDRHMQSRTQPRGPNWTPISFLTLRKRLATTIFRRDDRSFLFLCVGNFFVFLGYWIPLFYVVPFATIYLKTSSADANYLLAVLNAGSFVGRVVPAWVSQLVGAANILFFGAAALGTLVFVWLGIGNVAGITVWSFLVGYDMLSDLALLFGMILTCKAFRFMSGIVVSIPNAVASRLSKPANVGSRIGIMWTVSSFAELIGTPIAGALVTENGEGTSYIGGQIFGGLSILLGAAFLIIPAWAIFRDNKLNIVELSDGRMS